MLVDVDVNPNNPTEFYVAYASGGLWYSNNNGVSFTPVMDNSSTQNLGDIAVDWKNGTIWAGTGENNASRSSYAGIGILKSTDKGQTWQHMGLPDSHHIGRILINPNQPDEVIIGVTGHLYSSNSGESIKHLWWKNLETKHYILMSKLELLNVAVSPKNFNIVYAAAWEKIEKHGTFLATEIIQPSTKVLMLGILGQKYQ